MKSEAGTYVLVLRSRSSRQVQIGKWGILDIRPGYYLYVGSAFGPGGLLARVSRHCRREKPRRWHVDYLREFLMPESVWYSYGPNRYEHEWAAALAMMEGMSPVRGFGCSDCRCGAHLFFSSEKPGLAEFVHAIGGRMELSSCECSQLIGVGQ